MKLLWCMAFCVICLATKGFGSAEIEITSPHYYAIGNTSLVRNNSAYVMMHNPSLLGYVENNTISFSFKRLYNLEELELISLSANYNYKIFSIGLLVSNFGESQFWNQNSISLGFSSRINRYINLGIRMGYYQVSFDNKYSSLSESKIAIGLSGEIESTIIHLSFYDLNQPQLHVTDQKANIGYKFGASFQGMEYLTMNMEISGRKNESSRYQLGQEIKLEDYLYLRFGLITNPTIPTAGFGINYSRFDIAYSINHHSKLGETHSFGLTIRY